MRLTNKFAWRTSSDGKSRTLICGVRIHTEAAQEMIKRDDIPHLIKALQFFYDVATHSSYHDNSGRTEINVPSFTPENWEEDEKQ